MPAHSHALLKAMTSLQLTSLAVDICGMLPGPRNWRHTKTKRTLIEYVRKIVVIMCLLIRDKCWKCVLLWVFLMHTVYMFYLYVFTWVIDSSQLANIGQHSFLCLFILALFHKTMEASSKTQSLFIQQDPLDRIQPKQNTPCCVIVIYLWDWNPGLVAGVLVGICVCYRVLERMQAI